MEKQLNRLDPENHLGFGVHAGRALGRMSKVDPTVREFESITCPAERRAAVTRAKFRNTGSHENEAERIRTLMLRMLDRIDGVRTPEQEALLVQLENQIDTAADIWTKKYPVEGAPTKDHLVTEGLKWLASLSAETLDGLLAICPKTAQLVVVPRLNFYEQGRLVKPTVNSALWNNQTSLSLTWKFGITDGRGNVPHEKTIYWEREPSDSTMIYNADRRHDGKLRNNEEMFAEYRRRLSSHGLGCMPQYGYIPLAETVRVQGKSLDNKDSTTFFEKDSSFDLMPAAATDSGKIILMEEDANSSSRGLRVRPWIEAEVPM